MWGEITYPFPNFNGAVDKQLHLTRFWACNYVSMLGLKLNHVSKKGHWWLQNTNHDSSPTFWTLFLSIRCLRNLCLITYIDWRHFDTFWTWIPRICAMHFHAISSSTYLRHAFSCYFVFHVFAPCIFMLFRLPRICAMHFHAISSSTYLRHAFSCYFVFHVFAPCIFMLFLLMSTLQHRMWMSQVWRVSPPSIFVLHV